MGYSGLRWRAGEGGPEYTLLMTTSSASFRCMLGVTVMSVPSLPQGTNAAPGAGTNTACVGMAPSPTSGLQLQCRLCRHHRDSSSWAVGLATPWPYVSCRHTLRHARISGSPAHSQMPQRTLNLRVPRTETDWKETRSVTSTQSDSDRMGNGALGVRETVQ